MVDLEINSRGLSHSIIAIGLISASFLMASPIVLANAETINTVSVKETLSTQSSLDENGPTVSKRSKSFSIGKIFAVYSLGGVPVLPPQAVRTAVNIKTDIILKFFISPPFGIIINNINYYTAT